MDDSYEGFYRRGIYNILYFLIFIISSTKIFQIIVLLYKESNC